MTKARESERKSTQEHGFEIWEFPLAAVNPNLQEIHSFKFGLHYPISTISSELLQPGGSISSIDQSQALEGNDANESYVNDGFYFLFASIKLNYAKIFI